MRKFGTVLLITILTISIAVAQTSKPDSTLKKVAQPGTLTLDTTHKVVAQPAKADSTIKVATGPKHTLDKIAGVVGSSIILQSDIELQYANYLASGNQPDPAIKCTILR